MVGELGMGLGLGRGSLPLLAVGPVVRGFGRGGRSLNCPTANLPAEVVAGLPGDVRCGVYFGWASVADGPVHPMCMSIGYNPHFKDTHKTMETHIMHDFGRDFYGEKLKIAVLGFLRTMSAFTSLEGLMEAIEEDKRLSREALKSPAAAALRAHPFFLPGGEDFLPAPAAPVASFRSSSHNAPSRL